MNRLYLKRLLFWLKLIIFVPSVCWSGSIALSFDDGLDPLKQPKASSWNASILKALSDAQIKSVLFAAGKRVDSPAGLDLVKRWGNAGHTIANHTYSHFNFGSGQTTLDKFIADTKRNEKLLNTMPGWDKRFRFPYLKEGNTKAKRDGFRNWLKANNYKSGAVSIDASDWYYNKRYLEWRKHNPGADPTPFRSAYLNHLWSRTLYYDALAKKILHRKVNHIILLHTNAVNASFLPDIIAMYRSKGWAVISPDKAYTDPVYTMTPNTLPAGESLIWALAKQNGIDDLRYPAESDVYEKPVLDKLGL